MYNVIISDCDFEGHQQPAPNALILIVVEKINETEILRILSNVSNPILSNAKCFHCYM